MELFIGFRKLFIIVCLLLSVGNVKAQGEGGVAVGLGLGGDLMVDSFLGEIPNPLLTAAAQGGQHRTGPGQAAQANTIQPTGGGFNVHRFPVLGTNTNTLFPIDASRIAGVANGQTIYLPGFLSNQLHSGSNVVLPAHTTSTSAVDPNQKYVLKNEDFTALGNIGHHVRVPVPNLSVTNNNISNTGPSAIGPDGTITIDPKDIIGVADMSKMGADGNPAFMSFNPGSGHTSEISALQSALQGTPVDMSGFLPPPFDPISSNQFPVSGTSSSTTFTTNTEENTSFDIVIETGQTNANTTPNTQGVNSASIFDNQLGKDAVNNDQLVYKTKTNSGSSSSKTNSHTKFDTGITKGSTDINTQSLLNTNEQTITGTGSISAGMNPNEQSMSNTNGQSMFGTGSTGSLSNGFNLNEQSMMKTNERSMLDAGPTGSVSRGMSLNEQPMTNTNEQSMFGTGNTNSVSSGMNLNEQSMMKTNERSMLDAGPTGSVSRGMNLNEQSMTNTNERSMFGTGSTDSVSSGMNLNDLSMMKTNERSMPGIVPRGMNLNEQPMTNTNERSTFGTGSTGSVSRGMDLNEQSMMKTNERSMLDAGPTGIVPRGMNLNEQSMTNTNERSMFGTGSTDSVSSGMNLNEQTMTNTNQRSMLDAGPTRSVSRGMNLNEQSITNTNERSMFGTGSTDSVSSGMNLNDQSVSNTNQRSMLDAGPTRSVSRGMNLNEQSITNTNERSMFGTGSTDSVSSGMNLNDQSVSNTNQRSMLNFDTGNTGSLSGGMNLNEQSMTNRNEQSAFGPGSSGSVASGMNLNEQSMTNTNERSMFDTGSVSSGMNFNEQSMTNTNAQSMFGVGDMTGLNEQNILNRASAVGGTNLKDQSLLSTNERLAGNRIINVKSNEHLLLNTGTNGEIIGQNVNNLNSITGKAGNRNILSAAQTETNNLNVNGLLSNANIETGLNNRIGISGQTDTFTTGQLNKQSVSENQKIPSKNEPSLIKSGVSRADYVPDNLSGQNIGRKITNNEQSMLNTEMRQANIITRDQLRLNENRFTNKPNVVNVDANIGVKTGPSNIDETSIGGLFGRVDRRKDGSISSRFNDRINPNSNTGMNIAGGEQMYAVDGNTATSTVDGTADLSLVRPTVDAIQPLPGRTANILGVSDTSTDRIISNNNEQLSLSLINSVTQTADSSNNAPSLGASGVTDRTGQNIPHVNDLNTGGIYPFEGSLTAMDATLAEGSSAVLDMSSVLQGKEPLHLEPSMNIVGEVVSGTSTSETPGNRNTGIFAVASGNGGGSMNLQESSNLDTSSGRSLSTTRDTSTGASALSSTNRNINEVSGVSFVSGGSKANGLAIDNVSQYVGAENANNKRNTFGGSGTGINALDVNKINRENRGYLVGENTSQMTNTQSRLTEGKRTLADASRLSNDNMKGLTVAGNINNNINTINTLEASSNILNKKDTTVTDGVGVAMSGFSGAPITNMVGVRPGTSRGGLTVKGFDIPSYQITSKTNEFSSDSTQEFSARMSGGSDLPSGSFVIGAGQPNSKVINTGSIGSLSASNVGGVAIGAGDQTPSIQGISLPQSAFKSNDRMAVDRKQTHIETPKYVKVDMSSFIPPPYEEPRSSSSLNIQDQRTIREGATADIVKNAALLDMQNNIDRSHNQVPVFNQRPAFAQRFNDNVNKRTNINEGLSGIGGSIDASLIKSRTSIGDSSNTVTSSEHFGKPIRSDTSSRLSVDQQRSRSASVSSIGRQSEIPSIVVDRAIFTDLAKDTNESHKTNEVAVALDINRNTNQVLGHRSLAERPTSQPIVGSIFGTAGNTSSTLTKRFLEKSGITREPAVDFMTNFLQNSKPSRNLNHGTKNLQIVPLGSDISNLSPNSDKLIIAGRQSDARTVDKFGVADIYTRRQQLNPSQWQQFMAKVSHEPSRLNGINVDYQTKNVIGTGETRPLARNINQGLGSSNTRTSSEFSSNTITRDIDRTNTNTIIPSVRKIPSSRRNNVKSAILFEAPGMTGHKSVTIRNYVPRTLRRPSSPSTMHSGIKSSGEVGQQSLQEFVGTQATAERTSSFANTFRQNQHTGSSAVPIFNQNAGMSLNSVSLPLKDRLSTAPQIQQQGQLGESGQKIQNEMNTFKLGRSILISDGEIPDFTGPNSVHQVSLPIDASALKTLSANGIRLGQPAIMSQGSSFGSNMMSNQQSTLEALTSQSTNSRQSGIGSLGSQIVNNRPTNIGSVDSRIGRQSILGSLDSQMTNNLQSKPSSLGSQMRNNRKSAMASIDSLLMNNRQTGIGSLDSQLITNQQSNMGSLDSQLASNFQSPLGSRDSQLMKNRQSSIGLLDPRMLNSQQSTIQQSQTESQNSMSGEMTIQGGQGTSFAEGLGPGRQGASLSKRLGIAIGGGLGSDFSIGIPQRQQNTGIGVGGELSSAMGMKSDATQISGSIIGSNRAVQNIGIPAADQLNAGMTATNAERRSQDTAAIIGLNDALKTKPMEPTLFTSGSRFAVFGRADDVTGKSLGSMQETKPIPARRMGVLGPVHDCRYKPDPSSEYYFIYRNGITQHRFRCALGTAFDEMTCECSIRVSDHGDCLEVHMDFNNGIVEDSSLNRLPIGNENVEITNSTSPIAGISLFGGDGKLTIWRYQNYDFRDHIMLKVQFRPGVGGDRYQPLISNCDGGGTGPSVAIIYDSSLFEVILMLQTVNDTLKELRFKVNPDEWTDVTFIYDGQEFIGIVNGVRRYVSRENPHLLGIIGGEIKSTPTHGLIEIRDAAIVLGHCPMYGHYRGAMVDIQIYTCIPKDFRLE